MWIGLAVALVVVVVLCTAIGRGFWGLVGAAAIWLGVTWYDQDWSLTLGLSISGPPLFLAGLFGIPAVRREVFGKTLLGLVGRALPQMSETERAALDAGTVWWDRELFSGRPTWSKLVDFRCRTLTSEERHFLDGPVWELCGMCEEHAIEAHGDLPPNAWEFIRSKGLMGMIIPKEYGGLGFSAAMNSAVVVKLSSRSVTAAVSVMVPNSLGPAELLLHYGTDEQKQHWLPRLARGEEIPCFALTEPHAGSDAASIRARGVVCKGQWQGREVVGMRLSWNKRYITLAPIATVIGLAFKLEDPEGLVGTQRELGITCALIPRGTRGVVIGERHDPLGVPFLNGPTRGEDVFVPLDFIIGGPKMAGRGWRMLMDCLSAGRGISLPGLAVGACELATRVTGAHATLREQFGLPLGRFEGVEAKLARIAGLTYLIDGGRRLTLGAIDAGEKPSVLTAIMKAYATEGMRTAINDAMDVLGGAGICRGPRNVLASAYRSIPIGITVEGANILTRTMIIFGQGAIRCHPWVQSEMRAVELRDVEAFDEAFWGHVNLVFTNAARSFVFGLTGGAFASAPVAGPARKYYQRLSRLSAAFSLCGDAAMATLGGNLKRRENLTGRLADALAHIYLASGALKRFYDEGSSSRDVALMSWACEHALDEAERALAEFQYNLPQRFAAFALRRLVFPFGRRNRPPSDRLAAEVARGMLDARSERQMLTRDIYLPPPSDAGLGRLEAQLARVVAAQPARAKLKDAQRARKLEARGGQELLDQAVAQGILTAEECKLVRDSDQARDLAAAVDSFGPGELERPWS